MIIDQISVFAENKPGKLAEILSTLEENNVSILALSVADTSDFGIARIVVREPDKVKDIFKAAGLTAKMTPVLSIAVEDKPGELLRYVKILSAADINIEYTYAYADPDTNDMRVVLKVDKLDIAKELIDK